MNSDCTRTGERLEARRESRLSSGERRRLDAHLPTCADCRRQAEETEPLALFASLTDQPLPPGVAPFILGGVRAEEKHRGGGLLEWLEPLPALASLALATILVLAWAGGPTVSPAGGTADGRLARAPEQAVAEEALPALDDWLGPHSLTNAIETVEDIRSPTAEVFALALPGEGELILIVDENMDL